MARYTFENGKTYTARIKLSGLEAMVANASRVSDRLKELGLSATVVALGKGFYRASGKWTRATESITLPATVLEVKEG